MSGGWREYRISADGSHHLYRGRPAYTPRFCEVSKFRAPGLAPVRDVSGAYHITSDGRPAYGSRYARTFGFYEGRAAVQSSDGWLHILPAGNHLYSQRYAWCGNFQENRSAVRRSDGQYFHIGPDGAAAYEERYRYAGDFKDGFAVVQRADGRHSHIDASGGSAHNRWFLDLDVFHKGYARARDRAGWHHINVYGESVYEERFNSVEPFYNGQARVEGFDGRLSVIDESGRALVEIRKPLRSPMEELSADMVGMWRTQTIRAAVELGVFESLPASAEEVENRLRLGESMGIRLMRALDELGLVSRDGSGTYHPTEKGAHLQQSHPLSLADAARMWGGESYVAWAGVTQSIKTGHSNFEMEKEKKFFDWLQDRPRERRVHQAALAAYAKHDYGVLADVVDFGAHDHILDVGGGSGELTFALLRAFPHLKGTVMDKPEVVREARTPEDVKDRCRFVAGNFFEPWSAGSDAVVLARVLHDWPDSDAVRILCRAREVMPRDGMLYVVELVLDDAIGSGGLLDLHMLVVSQGTERTEEQFSDLLGRAGFAFLGVVQTGRVNSVIRARAV